MGVWEGTVNELHLFAGAGGGILGGMLLGHTCVCAVEIEPYPRAVLLQRQRDGILPRFPIWDDVCTFDGKPWRGLVDVVCGGFPCQPFSSASRGRRTATDLWPEMLRIVLEVAPQWVFAENVQRAPLERASRDLENAGYMVRCARVAAASVGAAHQRRRYWLLADADQHGKLRQPIDVEMARASSPSRGNPWTHSRPDLVGVDDGLPSRMDRLAAIGNGQVPHCVALAWTILCGEAIDP